MSSPPNQPSVLVVGGCGFVGFHIVRHLVQDFTFSSVTALSRFATRSKQHHVDGAQYIDGDITNRASIQQALEALAPTVIIHASSAPPTTGSAKEFKSVTVDGTKNLVELALESKHVQVFVYTSSNMANAGLEHLVAREDCLLANKDPKAALYARAKADAEDMVLGANNTPTGSVGPGDWAGCLATGALRFPMVYGSHNAITIAGCMDALLNKQTKVVIGDGNNLWSYCSSRNAAESHLVLARALLNPDKWEGIAGEAFNINDGEPHLFWGFPRDCWRIAGHQDKSDHSSNIPAWFALALANILEFLYWVFTFGTKRPGLLGRQQVEYCCFTNTYNVDKARTRLGFVPQQHYDEVLEEGVRWYLEHGDGTKG
ncbi:NAD(P)-binding protein [Corynespora cassiicola Philippines]|uniref:NAD(P)-binding protein n=1 Tax=Corynespora cassiicola Philippines TaxID=1448308 RepID=A0A2T2NI89_CORCC|nr:NAD(P)-binding protein [Corynespora cassiicola Philippines]